MTELKTESLPGRDLASASLGVAWWYFLLRGLTYTVGGSILLFKPVMSAVVFTQIIGAFMLLDGVLSIVAGFTGVAATRVWSIARGAIIGLVGWLVFSRPAMVAGFTAEVLIYIIAAIVLIGGVWEIKSAIKGDERKSRQPSLLGGALLVALGLLLLFAPLSFGILIVRIIGGVAISIGIVLLFLAFRVRKLRKKIA